MTTFTNLGAFFLAGAAAGFVSQRSRLCFVSALRDLYLFRATAMTRAILLLLFLATLGGALVVPGLVGEAAATARAGGPSVLDTLLAGALFGLGMVLAGSCAVGALWRLGEGQLSQLWIMIGIFIGSWAYVLRPWNLAGIRLPSISGWLSAGGLAAVLGLLLWWERRQAPTGEEMTDTRQWSWREPWLPEWGAVALVAVFLMFLILTGQTWTVTRAFLFRYGDASAFVLGVVLGGLAAALLGREWRLRPLGPWPHRALRVLGGLLMGYGARLGWGCTIGALLSGMTVFPSHAWLWLLGAIIGAWVGARILRRFMHLYL